MPNIYPSCEHTKKPDTANIKVSREAIEEYTRDFRVLPSYEKQSHDYVHKRYYSLLTNEYLSCRWAEFKNIRARIREPYNLPGNRDDHFYINNCRLLPSETIGNRTDFRMKMSPGPGVDSYGTKPIPADLLMKRLKADRPSISKQRNVKQDVAKNTAK